jgi:isoleucyl-tRNA synthetase
MEHLISEEINVKSVKFVDRGHRLVSYSAKPKFGSLGPKLGDKAKLAAERIKSLSEKEILELKNKGSLDLQLNGSIVQLTDQDVEIVASALEGYSAETEAGYQVALDLKITAELEDEGLARDLVNRVQNLRKEAGFEVTDRIKLYLQTDDRVKKAVQRFTDYIRNETLTSDLLFENRQGSLSANQEINGHPTYLAVEKVK